MSRQLRKIYEKVIIDQDLDQRYIQAIQNNDNAAVDIIKQCKARSGYRGQYFSGSLGDRGFVYKRAEQNGIWLSRDKQTAIEYATAGGNQTGKVNNLTIKMDNPLDMRELGIQNTQDNIRKFMLSRNINLPEIYYQEFQAEAEREEQDTWFCYAIIDGRDFKRDRQLAIAKIEASGFDGLILKDTHYGSQSDSYVCFHSNQVKLNKIATLDDSGIIIPATSRFDWNNPDIRY